jgi:hypothetical protein
MYTHTLSKAYKRVMFWTWYPALYTGQPHGALSRSLLRTVQPYMGLEVLSKDKWALVRGRVGEEEEGPDPVPPPPRTFSIFAISNCLNPSRNGLLSIAGTHSDSSSSSRGLIPLTNDSFLLFFCFVWGIVKVVSFVVVGPSKFWVLFCQVVIKLWAFFV